KSTGLAWAAGLPDACGAAWAPDSPPTLSRARPSTMPKRINVKVAVRVMENAFGHLGVGRSNPGGCWRAGLLCPYGCPWYNTKNSLIRGQNTMDAEIIDRGCGPQIAGTRIT